VEAAAFVLKTASHPRLIYIAGPRWHLNPRFRIYPLHLLIGALLMLLGSFRVIAVPFILLNTIRSTKRRSAYNRVVEIGLLLTLLSPIDIGIPFLATVMGNAGSGVRVRHIGVGVPAVSKDHAGYGEFVSLGDGGLPGFYKPVWWVVWWKHNAIPNSIDSAAAGDGAAESSHRARKP